MYSWHAVQKQHSSAVPISRVPRPTNRRHWLKYATWRVYAPLHPVVRNAAQYAGLSSDHFVGSERAGRQPFMLGRIKDEKTAEAFVEHLVNQGFGNHFIAWLDEGEVASLRLVENFVYQYHVRIFEDGEVRGHYEFTPECHPIKHLRARGQEDRRETFADFFGDFVVPHA